MQTRRQSLATPWLIFAAPWSSALPSGDHDLVIGEVTAGDSCKEKGSPASTVRKNGFNY